MCCTTVVHTVYEYQKHGERLLSLDSALLSLERAKPRDAEAEVPEPPPLGENKKASTLPSGSHSQVQVGDLISLNIIVLKVSMSMVRKMTSKYLLTGNEIKGLLCVTWLQYM